MSVLLITGQAEEQTMAIGTFGVAVEVMGLTVPHEVFATLLKAGRAMVFVDFALMSSFPLVRMQTLDTEMFGHETPDGCHGVIVMVVIVKAEGFSWVVAFTVAEPLIGSGAVDDHSVVTETLDVAGEDLQLSRAANFARGNSQTFL